MSNFTNRLNAIGEFSVGDAKFAVLEVRGAFIRCAQTHDHNTGARLPQYDLTFDANGILDVTGAQTSFPVGFIVPQTHQAFNAIKAQIADLDNQNLELCPVCVGNAVDPQTLVGACTSCLANASTIAYLKTV